MSIEAANEMSSILNRVREWQPGQRIALARRILQDLEDDSTQRPAPPKSLASLLGLLKIEGEPPSDEQCEAILKEELIKKYGR